MRLKGAGVASLAVLAMSLTLILGACSNDPNTPTPSPTATATAAATATPLPTATPEPEGRTLHVTQPAGKVVYWVLPGPRRIDPAVFGTPADPKQTGAEQMELAQGPIKELLQQFPLLVGLPLGARMTSEDGSSYTQTSVPTPFGDNGAIVSGSLDLTYVDLQPADTAGNPMATKDSAKLELAFTDPQGHAYDVQLRAVFMPPIPGNETQGGVLIDDFHHGTTGTGSPLMPLAYTYGAFWAIADVMIDGALADQGKVVHCMTTTTTRDADYRLATADELPLPLENTIAGITHHTHCIVLPITLTPEGPKFEPVKTAFKLPNGAMQPFIHMMFEQEDLGEATGFVAPQTVEEIAAKYQSFAGDSATSTISIKGSEFEFSPADLQANAGETVRIVFENTGTLAHNLTFAGLNASTATIQPGQTAEVVVTVPDTAGPLQFFCSVAGHQGAGMVGHIAIQQ